MTDSFDNVIIGAGPGGYVAAIRSAQLGFSTAIVEKRDTLGGTCLNIGCIPSKALLDSSEHYFRVAHELRDHGIHTEGLSLDLAAMMSRKQAVVAKLTVGVSTLLDQNGVAVFHGSASVPEAGRVRIEQKEPLDLKARNIVLAMGSVPSELPVVPVDGSRVVTSTEALEFQSVPKRLIVVGGGAIGLEMASVWARLGSEVTIVELMDTILPGWDVQSTRTILRSLKKLGIDVRTATQVTGCDTKSRTSTIETVDADGHVEKFAAERVIVAVGRKPYGLEDLKHLAIKIEDGRINVDGRFETNVRGIFAIGDLIAGPMLAHKAEEDGIACIEAIAGKPVHVDYGIVPSVVYTWPEVASVGSTEEELAERGIDYAKGSFPFAANGRALAAGEADGFVKVLSDSGSDRILGAHIVGPNASALISELVAVMAFGGSSEDLGRLVHAHPTLPEAIREAGLSVLGRAIHATPKL